MARYAPPQHPDDLHQRQKHAQQKTNDARERNEILRAVRDRFFTYVKETETNNHENRKTEEIFRRQSLFWTRVNAGAAVAGAIILLFYTCFTYGLLRVGQDNLGETQRQARAALDAAETARKQLELSNSRSVPGWRLPLFRLVLCNLMIKEG